MNTKELQCEYQRNINEERSAVKKNIPDRLLVGEQYQIMTTWLLETQSGPFQLLDLIQHLDDIGCHQSTKYLAKTYLDLYLSRQTEVISDNLHLMAITASRLAFKFNESQQYPISFAEKVASFRYLPQEFIRMENQILTVLDFNLNYVTPYHYLQGISQLVGFKDDMINQITQMIDFSCTLKELVALPAGEMLMSILLYLAYSYDPEKIQIIRRYGSAFPNLAEVVLLLNQKATEGDEEETQQ